MRSHALEFIAILSLCASTWGCAKASGSATGGAPAESLTPSAVAAPSASAVAINDGTDPKLPTLSPDDIGFTDGRKGAGWGDRCFTEYKAGKLGWARAACDKGLSLPGVDEKAKPPLLYNEGLIARSGGDTDSARSYFTRSLALRPPGDPGIPEVEKELRAVGGVPPPASSVVPRDIPLECHAVSAATQYDLFLKWNNADATGFLRTTTGGAATLRAVTAELYKGEVLVHPAGEKDLRNIIATELQDPKKTMQVGDHKQPTLPCQ